MNSTGAQIFGIAASFASAGGFSIMTLWQSDLGKKKPTLAAAALALSAGSIGTVSAYSLSEKFDEKTISVKANSILPACGIKYKCKAPEVIDGPDFKPSTAPLPIKLHIA